jgi:hypothetical protein
MMAVYWDWDDVNNGYWLYPETTDSQQKHAEVKAGQQDQAAKAD